MMACAEPVMEQARGFMAALSATRSHALVGGQLVLRDDAGTVLATLAPMQPAALPGSRWSATAVNNGKEAVVSLLTGTEITAEFGSDGALAGGAGCNRYTARYTLDGERVRITPPALTRRACEADVMQQEQDYTAALAGRDALNATLDDVFNEYDAILTPAAPGEAPRGEATGNPIFCTTWTYLGTPAVTVPLLRSEAGLPLAIALHTLAVLSDPAAILGRLVALLEIGSVARHRHRIAEVAMRLTEKLACEHPTLPLPVVAAQRRKAA